MAYKRKDGRWVEKVTENGKTKYIYGETRAQVLKKSRHMEREKEVGKPFCDVAAEWKKEHFPALSPSTQSGYMAPYKRAIEYLGKEPITNIDSRTIGNMIESMRAKRYAKKTVKSQLGVIRMVFDYAIRRGYCENNPTQYVDIPRNLPQKKREIPTDEEIELIKKTDWLFPLVILYTGARRGEAIALEYDDFDFKNKKVKIGKAIVFSGNKPILKLPKTSSGIRTVPLVEPLEKAVLEKMGKNKKGLLFPNNGRYYHLSALARAWKKWQKETGVTVTMHQLRHAYATMLYDAGIECKDAQRLMGHSDFKLTMNVYTHIREIRENESREKLNKFLNAE